MNITILGGTGFVGSNLISCLDKTGNNIAVITRNREKNKKILVYPKVKLIEADVHNQEDLLSATRNTDVLINLIGILNEKGHSGRGFRKAHSDLARNILNACKNNEIKRILHMSALNARSTKQGVRSGLRYSTTVSCSTTQAVDTAIMMGCRR